MIALNPRLSTLTRFKSRHLLALSMQLLNFSRKATHLVSGLRRALSHIVGDDEVRAVARHLNPETLHSMVFSY
jgi:hypothetical protein